MTAFAATICLAALTLHPQSVGVVEDEFEVVHHNKHYSDDATPVHDSHQTWSITSRPNQPLRPASLHRGAIPSFRTGPNTRTSAPRGGD